MHKDLELKLFFNWRCYFHRKKIVILHTNLLLPIYIGLLKKGQTSNKHFSSNRITICKKTYYSFQLYYLYSIWKEQLYKISGSEFYEWLFGPENISGLSRNGPQASNIEVMKCYECVPHAPHYYFPHNK